MERAVQTQNFNPPNYHKQQIHCGCQNCYYLFEYFDIHCALHYTLSDGLLIPNCSSVQHYYVEETDICDDWKPNWEVIKMVESVVRETGKFMIKSEDGKIFQIIEYTRYPIKNGAGTEKILWTPSRDPVRPTEDGIYEILTKSGLIKATLIKEEVK